MKQTLLSIFAIAGLGLAGCAEDLLHFSLDETLGTATLSSSTQGLNCGSSDNTFSITQTFSINDADLSGFGTALSLINSVLVTEFRILTNTGSEQDLSALTSLKVVINGNTLIDQNSALGTTPVVIPITNSPNFVDLVKAGSVNVDISGTVDCSTIAASYDLKFEVTLDIGASPF